MCYNCGVAWIFKDKLDSDDGNAPFEFSPIIAALANYEKELAAKIVRNRKQMLNQRVTR